MPFPGQHYRELFELLDQGFCIIEVLFEDRGRPFDYRFIEANPAFEGQTGLQDVVGRTMRGLVPDHDEHWFRIYGQVAMTGQSVRFEQRADALGRWFDVNAFRIGAPEQRRVAVLFSDISAKKRAERELHQSEARYRALAHATAQLLYRVSADGQRVLEVYGQPIPAPGLDAHSSAGWLEQYVHPDDRARTLAVCREALARGRACELELRARRADGSWSWIQGRMVPVHDEAGEIVEWVGSATDITGRIDAAEALRRSEAAHAASREAAERANRAKDEFLAMLGHELRNPLAPMLTALEVMQLRGDESREHEVLERQVGYLTRMVNDLLDIARITRGVVELRRRPVELAEIVVRAMEIASPLLEQRRHRVEMHVPRQGLLLDADTDRLSQVAANLLTNAAKYSDPGSRIVVTGTDVGRLARLTVRDEGIGIDPAVLATVFEPFVQHRLTSERPAGGLGLGLAIVHSLVEAHGGAVRAESAGLGQGSEFVVELPLFTAQTEREDSNMNQSSAVGDTVNSRARVLVVDDNEDAADMLRFALEHLGYAVDVAPDGPSALARAREFAPTVAVLDIGLPTMDGYELARRLRRDRGAELRLIALTGYGQDSDQARAMEAGFEAHLVKPIDLERLQHVIEAPTAP